MQSIQKYDIIIKLFLGVAQMVARYLGVVEAVGSNPATQTKDETAWEVIFQAVSFLYDPTFDQGHYVLSV